MTLWWLGFSWPMAPRSMHAIIWDRTALLDAIQWDWYEVIPFLLASGADIRTANLSGRAPMHFLHILLEKSRRRGDPTQPWRGIGASGYRRYGSSALFGQAVLLRSETLPSNGQFSGGSGVADRFRGPSRSHAARTGRIQLQLCPDRVPPEARAPMPITETAGAGPRFISSRMCRSCLQSIIMGNNWMKANIMMNISGNARRRPSP